MKVRDHNKALYERKKEKLVRAAEYLRFRHPKAGIEIELLRLLRQHRRRRARRQPRGHRLPL